MLISDCADCGAGTTPCTGKRGCRHEPGAAREAAPSLCAEAAPSPSCHGRRDITSPWPPGQKTLRASPAPAGLLFLARCRHTREGAGGGAPFLSSLKRASGLRPSPRADPKRRGQHDALSRAPYLGSRLPQCPRRVRLKAQNAHEAQPGTLRARVRCTRFGGIALVARARKAAKRWFTDRGAQANARRDEALRQVDADVLNEPIPEELQQALHDQGEAEQKPESRR
jgi:hypothetical protein